MIHNCNICNYSTIQLAHYLRHMQTDKHKLKLELIKKEEYDNKKDKDINKNLLIVSEKITKLEKTVNKEAEINNKNNKKITAKIEEVKKIANKNKEYAKSTLTILNELYKDNPPLEYPGDRKCLTALYEYYKLEKHQVMYTNKLQKALIKDYNNGLLLDTIIKILTNFLKKDNLHLQSIFNTDTSRHHYAAKYNNSWEKDKAGKYLSESYVKPL